MSDFLFTHHLPLHWSREPGYSAQSPRQAKGVEIIGTFAFLGYPRETASFFVWAWFCLALYMHALYKHPRSWTDLFFFFNFFFNFPGKEICINC